MRFWLAKLLFPAVILYVVPWMTAIAAAADSIVGTWKLVSFVARDEETGVETRPWGQNPVGYSFYTASGYTSVLGTAEGRVAPGGTGGAQPEALAKLYSTVSGFAGRYSVAGDRIDHHVEVASNPALVGTNQVRYVTFDDKDMRLRTSPISGPDGRRRVFVFHLRKVD